MSVECCMSIPICTLKHRTGLHALNSDIKYDNKKL